MDQDLAAFDAAWKATNESKDRTQPRALAAAYREAHPELESRYGDFDLPELVSMLDAARAAGNEARRIEIDLWLLSEFEPQNIGGVASSRAARRRRKGS